jgi:hypothetical protein
MKKIFAILFAVVLTFGLLGCTSNAEPIAQAVAQTQAAFTSVTATDIPIRQTVTLYPTKTATIIDVIPPTEIAATASQSWRIKDYPGSVLWATDSSTDTDTINWVESLARNNAIPQPYYWSWYQLPQSTRFADIEDYFKPIASEMKYRLGQDEQWNTNTGSDTFLLSFLKGSDQDTSMISMEFWSHTTSYDAQLLIFYVNPQ